MIIVEDESAADALCSLTDYRVHSGFSSGTQKGDRCNNRPVFIYIYYREIYIYCTTGVLIYLNA